MSETKIIKGEIEGWGREPNKFRGGRGSLGIKIDGEWHNLLGKLDDLTKIQNDFPAGTIVQFAETENQRGYLDIVEGSIKKIEKAQAYKEEIKNEPSGKKGIDFAVCFKAAVGIQLLIIEHQYRFGHKNVERVKCSKDILEQTEQLYLDFQKTKEKLKKEGKW